MWPAGPGSEDLAALHLVPWRISVALASEVARGGRPHVWRREPALVAADPTPAGAARRR
jgi:hypothetical protein